MLYIVFFFQLYLSLFTWSWIGLITWSAMFASLKLHQKLFVVGDVMGDLEANGEGQDQENAGGNQERDQADSESV